MPFSPDGRGWMAKLTLNTSALHARNWGKGLCPCGCAFACWGCFKGTSEGTTHSWAPPVLAFINFSEASTAVAMNACPDETSGPCGREAIEPTCVEFHGRLCQVQVTRNSCPFWRKLAFYTIYALVFQLEPKQVSLLRSKDRNKFYILVGSLQSSVFTMFAVVVSLVLLSAEAGSIRGREEGRTIAVKDVQADLQDAMEAVLRGDSASKRVANIEARVWQTFQALPKNEVGRLAPRGVRYLVHSYFMKEHGWLIKGLDPHGNQDEVSDVQDASILQDKAPALVESLLEARRSNHGLALNDVITMIATLERLIFDESFTLLQAAYNFNGVSMDGSVEQKSVHDVLTSYLLLFQLGNKGNLTDARLHRALKARVSQRDDWLVVDEFQRDAVLNHDFAKQSRSNPFVVPLYTFQAGAVYFKFAVPKSIPALVGCFIA